LHDAMSEPPRVSSRLSRERAAREERLANALRDNLRRRKEQARAQKQRAISPDDTPEGGDGGPPA
jgi:hypothetical protein